MAKLRSKRAKSSQGVEEGEGAGGKEHAHRGPAESAGAAAALPPPPPPVKEAAPPPAEAAGEGGEGEAAEGEPFPLLSLPPSLLAAHVLPHLGPMALEMLRSSCKQLREATDGLLGPEMRVPVSKRRLLAWAQLSAVCEPSSGTKSGKQTKKAAKGRGASKQQQEEEEEEKDYQRYAEHTLAQLCSLLQRAQGVTSLTLCIDLEGSEPLVPDTAEGSQGRGSKQGGGKGAKREPGKQLPQQASVAAGLAWALRRLGEAAGGRLRKLAVIAKGGMQEGRCCVPVSPAVLEAVGSHFPQLTHLRLGPCMAETAGEEEWAGAVQLLPQSLQRLRVDVKCRQEWERPGVCQDGGEQAFLGAVQRQVLQLASLRSLHLEWSHFDVGFGPFETAAAEAAVAGPPVQAPLERVTLRGGDAGADMGPLAAGFASAGLLPRLRSLTLDGVAYRKDAEALVALIRSLPNLTHLGLDGIYEWNMAGEIWGAISSLQHLTCLDIEDQVAKEALLCSDGVPGGPKAAAAMLPATLTNFTLMGDEIDLYYLEEMIANLPERCRLTVEGLLRTTGETAAQAIARPGGFSQVFYPMDHALGLRAKAELPGMVLAPPTPELLKAAAKKQPVRTLVLDLGHKELHAMELLKSCAADCLGSMHTLAIRFLDIRNDPLSQVWEALLELLEGGLLPSLRTLQLHFIRAYFDPGIKDWAAAMAHMNGVGCTVHLMRHKWTDEDYATFLEALKWVMPDPDMVLLGARADLHGEGCP